MADEVAEFQGYLKTIRKHLYFIENEVMTSQEDEIDWDEVNEDVQQIIEVAEKISELRNQ